LVAGVFARRRLHAWSRVWKRDLFDSSIRFPEGACFEDVSAISQLLLKAKSFYYAAEPWVYYRSRPGSIMAKISRKSHFDTRRHDDLARALSGFGENLRNTIPDADAATLSAVGRFQAREFAKIVKRLIRARRRQVSWSTLRPEATRYRQVMEADSPIAFPTIARQYAREGKIFRSFALCLALSFTATSADVN
jgi:hypothetical protein